MSYSLNCLNRQIFILVVELILEQGSRYVLALAKRGFDSALIKQTWSFNLKLLSYNKHNNKSHSLSFNESITAQMASRPNAERGVATTDSHKGPSKDGRQQN